MVAPSHLLKDVRFYLVNVWSVNEIRPRWSNITFIETIEQKLIGHVME
jgi:hypothetical protein